MTTFSATIRTHSILLSVAAVIVAAPVFADTVTPLDDVTTAVIVRQSASSSSARVGSLRLGEQALLLGSVPNWYRIQLGTGTAGFVSKRWTRVLSSGGGSGGEAGVYTMDVIDVGTG